MEEELQKIPVEAVLKWYKKKTDKKIAELNQEIGELKAYIEELEDAEKREIRIICRAKRKSEKDFQAILKHSKKLEEKIKVLNRDKEDLLTKLNSKT